MLPFTLAAITAALGWLIYRHTQGHRAPILIGLTCVLLIGLGAIEWRWRSMQDHYSDVARDFLNRPEVHVKCQRATGAMFNVFNRQGYVAYNADGSLPTKADLTWETCRSIRSWVSQKGKDVDEDTLIAVHVLSHEIQHLAGHRSESVTECYAIQHDATIARLLGATSVEGETLAALYYERYYPRMRSNYRTADCAPGGALDLNPDTPAWPTG